jgi:hypothetical protein
MKTFSSSSSISSSEISRISGPGDGIGRSNHFASPGRIGQKSIPASATSHIASRCPGVHERFIATEGVEGVLFDTVDEIVPDHVAGGGKVRALGQNEKPNAIELKSAPAVKSLVNDLRQAFVEVRTFCGSDIVLIRRYLHCSIALSCSHHSFLSISFFSHSSSHVFLY